jgi:hypothetical protein
MLIDSKFGAVRVSQGRLNFQKAPHVDFLYSSSCSDRSNSELRAPSTQQIGKRNVRCYNFIRRAFIQQRHALAFSINFY